ncbi:hexose-6-phosphate:phosphate antiporter, partial [Listeria monocytogenes]|nr:hexose-6-phosphate:phosphate antiporter [Listeria monocytogenes]
MSLFSLKRKNYFVPLEIQRQQWFKHFIVAFMSVFICYLTVYLLRNNFKAAQTLLIEQNHFSTTELGMIGLAFSVMYGIGKTILG